MIAGSYTPFLFASFEVSTAWIISSIVWGIALIGSILKIFFTGRFVVASTILYLLMGWGAILIYEDLYELLSGHGFSWLIAGGVLYTSGAIFFLLDHLPYNHAVWHLFSMGGSSCHFYVITYYIALA
jgi:hemolysin III